MKEKYTVVGIMSGTSMDGTDLACCEFEWKEGAWKYQILAGTTVPYNEQWRVRISQLPLQNAENYHKTHVFYGRYLGILVRDFLREHQLPCDFIASHGHTIFHRPDLAYTAQIGEGASIQALSGLPVVCDFRSTDLALHGQGAPLVPIGDQLLFKDYEACLNLGGICNISYQQEGKTVAFDIAPCNIVLNRIARWMGETFDKDGEIAASASVDEELLAELNELPYYSYQGSKSLGREWINEEFWPIVKMYQDISEAEKMATLSEHIARQIAKVVNDAGLRNILVTGGGAFNTTLLNNLKKYTTATIVIPEPNLVNYKEALIFAFLGVLRVRNEINVLKSVTGSRQNHVAGALYGNFSLLI